MLLAFVNGLMRIPSRCSGPWVVSIQTVPLWDLPGDISFTKETFFSSSVSGRGCISVLFPGPIGRHFSSLLFMEGADLPKAC